MPLQFVMQWNLGNWSHLHWQLLFGEITLSTPFPYMFCIHSIILLLLFFYFAYYQRGIFLFLLLALDETILFLRVYVSSIRKCEILYVIEMGAYHWKIVYQTVRSFAFSHQFISKPQYKSHHQVDAAPSSLSSSLNTLQFFLVSFFFAFQTYLLNVYIKLIWNKIIVIF